MGPWPVPRAGSKTSGHRRWAPAAPPGPPGPTRRQRERSLPGGRAILEARSGVGGWCPTSGVRTESRSGSLGGPTSARPWLRPLFQPEQCWPGPRAGQKLAGRSSRILTATFLGGRRDRGRGRSPGCWAAFSLQLGAWRMDALPGAHSPCVLLRASRQGIFQNPGS